MKIYYNKINNEYEILKSQIHDVKEPITKKVNDNKDYVQIKPLVPTQVVKNIVLSNDLVFTCVDTLAQDIILTEIKILDSELNDIVGEVTDFWDKKTLYQVYLAIKDRLGYGYGALEILFDENNNPVGLEQVSAETLQIVTEKDKYTGENSYYALYNNGTDRIKMRLSRFKYSPDDDGLPVLLWLGGGEVSNFFDIPKWLPAFNKISADTLLDELNAKKINEGNLLSGILTVVSPPMNKTEVDEDGNVNTVTAKEQIDNTLQEQMANAGVGLMTLHLQQLTAELPLNIQYIPITENNYDYLRQLAEDCDSSILRLFKIPKARLLIDDTKESMNSNKTATLWEIYTKELESLQLVYEGEIHNFNLNYLGVETVVNIEVPIFVDRKEIETDNVLKLFNSGLLTLNQALAVIRKFYPDLEIDDDMINGNSRFYNGQLLGMADLDSELIDGKGLDDFYAFFDGN